MSTPGQAGRSECSTPAAPPRHIPADPAHEPDHLCHATALHGHGARRSRRAGQCAGRDTEAIDIFPNLNLPVIYVAQPYGGMDPAQMEGLLTNYYEYHFLYISGIHHVESRNVQGMAVMKLFFHPGTNMAQAMAETIGYVTRSRDFMPPGTVSPFITRFEAGSVPVGYLVLSSETKSIGEIQDQALFKVRPIFAGLPGVSAPPPFGGNQRTVVVRADPERLRSYALSPDELITALTNGNTISPSGNVRIGKFMAIVPINTLVRDIKELETIPIRVGADPPVYLRDAATWPPCKTPAISPPVLRS
ncbi:MAG: efflux RND transporter permease subunit [Isosphaeraceae bacterium]